MGGVFIGKCLVDAALVDAIQDGLQAAHIVDVAFQTVLDALYKIAFLEHYRVGAAMLFPGGAIIIVIFLALDPVCFSRHAAPTAPADQDAGKQIHCILLGRSPGIQSADTLDQLKILLGNQRLMGVRDANPFRGWPLLHLLDFVVWGALLPLYQCADIGFILQNADDRCSRPFAILFVGIAVFGIGKTIIFLIGQGGEDAHFVQHGGDPQGACPVQAHTEDVPDNAGSIRVRYKQIFVFLGFHIAVNGKGSNKISITPLYIQRGTGLDGNVPAVGFVHNVLDGYGQIVTAAFMGGVDVIRDGNKADPISGEHPAQVASGFDVLPSQAGEVLYNDAVDLAIGDVLHHFLKRRTVKNNTAVTIVDFFGYDLDVRVSFNEVLNQLPLVGNAVALAGAIICVRQTNISCCLIFWHEKALLSSRKLLQEKSGFRGFQFSSFSMHIVTRF